MNRQISVLVPCDLHYRDWVGAMLHALCREIEGAGEPQSFTHQVTSAFNEAFNNLAVHGGSELSCKQILVNFDLTETQLIIELHDDGRSFNIDKAEKPTLEKLRESGMGLFIMRSFMHHLEYCPGDGKSANVLRLVRNLTCEKNYV